MDREKRELGRRPVPDEPVSRREPSPDDVARVKLAVYRFFAETGRAPTRAETAARAGIALAAVRPAWSALRAQRLLVVAPDGGSILMAPPFSGVATTHVVESAGVRYFANCAWDALGVAAALRRAARVRSRCAQSGEALDLAVAAEGPEESAWLFHSLVPAARWWTDIVFT